MEGPVHSDLQLLAGEHNRVEDDHRKLDK
jgi:hypothetical protein